MRPAALLPILAICAVLLVGCGAGEVTTGTPRAVPSPTAGAPDADVRVVAEDEAQLHLWVSNQSFVDDPVHLTVVVDGVEVVDEEFDVEGQHNWQLFPVTLPAGTHRLEVTSGTGATLVETFRTGSARPRHAVVNYWNNEDRDGRFLDWLIQDEPVAFA